MHIVCDATATPLHIVLTGGQAHDGATLPALFEPAEFEQDGIHLLLGCEQVVADKGYDSKHVRALLGDLGIDHQIPTRRNSKSPVSVDASVYRQRNKVERVIGWLKENRRLATRYEKLAVSFRAFWTLGMIMRALRWPKGC